MSMKLTRWVVFELVPGGDILRIHEDLIDWNRTNLDNICSPYEERYVFLITGTQYRASNITIEGIIEPVPEPALREECEQYGQRGGV
ncbi:TPA: hypothetical protein I8Y21_004577 [Klebsiella oxytoca]|uniref:Uncharacterized protein n=1 Tax=Klebsiella oxytoca TaxID=571 RepID=A0AAN5LBB8_KLEOX|nr:hypothetical protein [Klebsiella oxytoca]